MARKKPSPKKTRKTTAKSARGRDRSHSFVRRIFRFVFKGILIMIALMGIAIVAFSFLNPPTTPYMLSERLRLGEMDQTWTDMEDIAPVMARSAVAAEDSNFCMNWGFELDAIRAAIEDGASRGGSTITQQVVKNVFLWQGRSWFRKSLEALMTPGVAAVWSKRRVLEVYLNIAEFDEGVFGVQAAAQHYFDVDASDLSATQAAQLAAILPSPKTRSASQPSSFVQRRAASIRGGAATIDADGRADCFQ